MALILLLHGLGATAIALLRRSLRFQELAIIEVGSYIVGYVGVGLAMALSGAGVYALVGAMIDADAGLNAVAATCWSVIRCCPPERGLVPGDPRVRQPRLGHRLLRVPAVQPRHPAVGRWAGTTQLGLYNRAKMLGELPSYHLTTGLSKVLFPSFSAIQLDQSRLRTAYLSAIGSLPRLVLPLNAGMAVAAPEIVRVVLGPQWEGAIAVMPVAPPRLDPHPPRASSPASWPKRNVPRRTRSSSSRSAATLALGMACSSSPEGRSRSPPTVPRSAAAAAVSHLGLILVLRRTLKTTMRVLLWPYARSSLAALVVAGAIAGCRAVLLEANAPLGLLLAAEVLTGALTLALMLRIGPLRVFRNDFAQRLANAAIIGPEGGRLSRPLTWVVGPPTESSTWPR
jgi:lipopolysaccharide exporter